MKILDLRLLPPLAFARFGSASEPQDNFELEEDADSLGFRKIIPRATLCVAEDGTASIRPAPDPSTVGPAERNRIFRDGDQIRPVAPFFQLFAVVPPDDETKDAENRLVPLTVDLLCKNNIALSAIVWNVHVENRKVFRRTGDIQDIVKADSKEFRDHHERVALDGSSELTGHGAKVDFGFVQFVKPDPCIESQILLRFTPGQGKIYRPFERSGDEFATPVYSGGAWPTFSEQTPKQPNENRPRETLPPSLYANEALTPPWLNERKAVSRGLLDDACDGFIEVTVGNFKAIARICVSPPSFIPDVRFIRTLADDLDQVVYGPKADDLDSKEARRSALDIVRRAYEAVSFMNVAMMNGNDIDGRRAGDFDTMPAEEAFATDRRTWPIMPPASVDTAAILALHQQIFAALSAGAAPWFARLLRRPDEIGDLTDHGRRKMPALMSGADGFYLALTHRQIATVERAADGVQPVLKARNQTARQTPTVSEQLHRQVQFNPASSRPEMAIANCCPGLEVDFRAVWRHLFEGIELSEHENFVVDAKGIDADGKQLEWLKDHRLLKVAGKPVVVTLQGPPPGGSGKPVTVVSNDFPGGILTMEWSNCFAFIVNDLRENGRREVECEFTASAAQDPVSAQAKSRRVTLRVRDFFEGGTAVISRELALAGELTQGLCSPWQNDLRECSCFYWASSRPDFVNASVGSDGLSHGHYWLAKNRSGEYVLDDYSDSRLVSYMDMFEKWELLQFQIGGKDSAPGLTGFDGAPRPRKP